MSNYKPGTVAMIKTFSTAPEIRILSARDRKWWGAGGYVSDENATSIQPLVVINPEDEESISHLVYEIILNGIIDNPVAAMTKALKQEVSNLFVEPQELGAKVVDELGQTWVRIDNDETKLCWYLCNSSIKKSRQWSDFTDVKIVD